MLKFGFWVVSALLCISHTKAIPRSLTCVISEYSDIADALETCDNLVIQNIVIPAETTLKIDLKDGSKLVFDGRITHEVAEWGGDLIRVTGKNLEIFGTKFHLLDGLGPKHWKGENESKILRPKLIRFTVEDTIIRDLKLKNCAANCFMVTKSTNVSVSNIHIDNYDGYPGVAGEKFAKNTDGFDVSGTNHLRVENSVVINQDDCVVVNAGTDMVFENIHCNGSHGLSFSTRNGNASDIQFLNSKIENGNNAIHVKTHSDGDFHGSIQNVLYKNIEFVGIDKYAISIQENYPEGKSVSNIPITNLTLDNVNGTMTGSKSKALQIICSKGACSDWHFKDVEVKGAALSNECQEVPDGIDC